MCIVGAASCSCSSFGTPQYVALPSGIQEVGYCG
jgi:hypothetical protein